MHSVAMTCLGGSTEQWWLRGGFGRKGLDSDSTLPLAGCSLPQLIIPHTYGVVRGDFYEGGC